MTFRELRAAVADHAAAGWSVDRIDELVIEPSGLSAEEKAAAWILARDEVAHAAAQIGGVPNGAIAYLQRRAEAFMASRSRPQPLGTE